MREYSHLKISESKLFELNKNRAKYCEPFVHIYTFGCRLFCFAPTAVTSTDRHNKNKIESIQKWQD